MNARTPLRSGGCRASFPSGLTRRRFIGAMLAATATGTAGEAFPAGKPPVFTAASGGEFGFDTGTLRGTLRGEGRAKGLSSLFHARTGAALAQPFGVFSHYRLLDDTKRYGTAAWDWASQATLSSDGAVEVRWSADDAHPFELRAVYRWSAANTLDLTTRVTARGELRRFEVFLASYFDGFPWTFVYAGGPPAFHRVAKEAGVWQMFPRDDSAVKMIQDGRWLHPPSPVSWSIRPRLAAPLAVRRDPERGLAAVVMAHPQDCFAVAAPHDEERHRSIYFSLFGRDLKPGESAEARSRLWIGDDLPDAKVVGLYEQFRTEMNRT